MRNLKRALSLGLASSMVLSTTAFTASAALAETKYPAFATTHFSDNEELTQEERNAIYIADQISLMKGITEDTFGAGEYVERSAMAVICTRLVYGDNFDVTMFPASNIDGSWLFNDVDPASSISNYIAAAYAEGLIAGVGGGNFDLGSNVILADGLVMILRALGYLQEPGWSGDNYKLAVARQASQLGLINLDTFNNPNMLDEPMTREEIAVMLVKALTDLAVVDYSPDKGGYHNRFNTNSENTVDNNDYISTLGWENFKLRVVDSTDDFNRPSEKWVKDNYTLANYTNTATWTSTKEESVNTMTQQLNAVIDEYNRDNFSYGIYVDGVEYSQWYQAHFVDGDTTGVHKSIASTETYEGFVAVMDSKISTKFLPSGQGALTEIFISDTFNKQGNQVTGTEGNVTISVINSHLGTVDSIKENVDGTFTTYITYFESVMQTHDADAVKIGLEFKPIELQIVTSEEFEVDRRVVIKATGDTLTALADGSGRYNDSKETIIIEYADETTGKVTEKVGYLDYAGGNYMVLDDETEIPFNIAMRGDLDEPNTMIPDLGANITVYLDDYGNALGYEEVEQVLNYLYVEGVPTQGASIFNGVEATVTLASTETGKDTPIYIKKVDGYDVTYGTTEQKIPADNRLYDGKNNAASANENFKMDQYNRVDETTFEKRIFAYTVNADGTYNLTSVDLVGLDDGILTPDQVSDPGKGDMAIFTSVRYADGVVDATESYHSNNTQTQITYSNWAEDDTSRSFVSGDTMMLLGNDSVKTGEDANGNDIFGTAYGKEGAYDTDARYGFAIRQGYGVYAVEMSTTGATKINYTGTYSGNYDLSTSTRPLAETPRTGYAPNTQNWDDKVSTKYQTAFKVDSDTIFIDVVTNNRWDLTDVENMAECDVNMQVLFGANGWADVVFINHGTWGETETESWNYFILKDNDVKEYYDEDGTAIVEYNVYVDGVLTTQRFTKEAIRGSLDVNVLYHADEYDGTVVTKTTEVIDYAPVVFEGFNADMYAKYKTALDAGTSTHELYNNDWSVVKSVGNQSFEILWEDDTYNNDYQGFDSTKGVKTFTWDADTVFVEVRYTKDGTIEYIKPANSSSLKAYDTTSNPPWVDVVLTDDDNLTHADLVTIMYPYDLGASEDYSDSNFKLLTGREGLAGGGSGTTYSSPFEVLIGVEQYEVPSAATMKDVVQGLLAETFSNYTVSFDDSWLDTDGKQVYMWIVENYSSNGTLRDTMYFSYTHQDSGLKYSNDGDADTAYGGKNTNGYDDNKLTTAYSGYVKHFEYWDVLDVVGLNSSPVTIDNVLVGNNSGATVYSALTNGYDGLTGTASASHGQVSDAYTDVALLKTYYSNESSATNKKVNTGWSAINGGDFLTTTTVSEAIGMSLTNFSASELGDYVGYTLAGQTSSTLTLDNVTFVPKADFLNMSMYEFIGGGYTGTGMNGVSIIPSASLLTLDVIDLEDEGLDITDVSVKMGYTFKDTTAVTTDDSYEVNMVQAATEFVYDSTNGEYDYTGGSIQSEAKYSVGSTYYIPSTNNTSEKWCFFGENVTKKEIGGVEVSASSFVVDVTANLQSVYDDATKFWHNATFSATGLTSEKNMICDPITAATLTDGVTTVVGTNGNASADGSLRTDSIASVELYFGTGNKTSVLKATEYDQIKLAGVSGSSIYSIAVDGNGEYTLSDIDAKVDTLLGTTYNMNTGMYYSTTGVASDYAPITGGAADEVLANETVYLGHDVSAALAYTLDADLTTAPVLKYVVTDASAVATTAPLPTYIASSTNTISILPLGHDLVVEVPYNIDNLDGAVSAGGLNVKFGELDSAFKALGGTEMGTSTPDTRTIAVSGIVDTTTTRFADTLWARYDYSQLNYNTTTQILEVPTGFTLVTEVYTPAT